MRIVDPINFHIKWKLGVNQGKIHKSREKIESNTKEVHKAGKRRKACQYEKEETS